MELFAALNQYTGGLLVTLIVAAVAGWLSQRRRLDKIELQFSSLEKTLADPRVGVVPRIEYESHRDEARQRLQKLEMKVG